MLVWDGSSWWSALGERLSRLVPDVAGVARARANAASAAVAASARRREYEEAGAWLAYHVPDRTVPEPDGASGGCPR